MVNTHYIRIDSVLVHSHVTGLLSPHVLSEPTIALPADLVTWQISTGSRNTYLSATYISPKAACKHEDCWSEWMRQRATHPRLSYTTINPGVKDRVVCLRPSRYREYFDTETLPLAGGAATASSDVQKSMERLLKLKTEQLGIVDLAALVSKAVEDGIIKPTSAYEPGQKV